MTTTMTTQTHSSRPNLRQTDFLPARFSGARLDRDDSTAHFLTFADYLDAHDIDTTNADQLPTIVQTFKRTLQGQARLWIDKITFKTYDDLKDSFIRRFSPAKSTYTHVRDFNTLTMTDGESTEAFLQRLRLTASYIDYGETQIRHRLLDSLPDDCRAAILMSASTADITKLTNDDIAAKAQLYMDLKTNSTTRTKDLTFSAQSEIDDLREKINSLKVTDTSDNTRGRTQTRRPATPRPTNNHSASRDRDHSRGRYDRRQDQSRDRHDRHRDLSYDRRGRSPYRNNTDRRDRRPRPQLLCHYCHIPGHVWRECRKRHRDMTRPPPPPPAPHSYHDYGQYHPQQQQQQQQLPRPHMYQPQDF